MIELKTTEDKSFTIRSRMLCLILILILLIFSFKQTERQTHNYFVQNSKR